MESKFDFFERVKIINPLTYKKKQANLKNALGTVLGKSQDDNGKWYYGVSIDNEVSSWSCEEEELESLGNFVKREDYYSGESVCVGVTKDGKGYIIDDNK